MWIILETGSFFPNKKRFQRFLERLQRGLAWREERRLSGSLQFTRTLLLVLPCGN